MREWYGGYRTSVWRRASCPHEKVCAACTLRQTAAPARTSHQHVGVLSVSSRRNAKHSSLRTQQLMAQQFSLKVSRHSGVLFVPLWSQSLFCRADDTMTHNSTLLLTQDAWGHTRDTAKALKLTRACRHHGHWHLTGSVDDLQLFFHAVSLYFPSSSSLAYLSPSLLDTPSPIVGCTCDDHSSAEVPASTCTDENPFASFAVSQVKRLTSQTRCR